MADTKLSAIATSASNLVAADQIVGVNAGATDLLFSGTQIKAFTSASPVLVTPNLGTPSAGVMTNVTGTAAGLTAGNVTTNANLTGPITSSGNATSIASQTGTGAKFVVDTSPTLVTPVLGVASGTSLALAGSLTLTSGALITTGNISAAAWTTNGLRNQMAAASYTDTSSSGTVAAAYTDLFGASTILASSATVYTNYYGSYFVAPIASTNVTMTAKWALGADTINVAGSGAASLSPTLWSGTLFTGGTGTTTFPHVLVQPTGAAARTTWSTAGTAHGINTAAGFTGNLFDYGVGGVAIGLLSAAGVLTLASDLNGFGVVLAGASKTIGFQTRGKISSPAAGNIQLGDTDTASPASQILRVQSVIAGNANVVGQNWTVIGSLSNGSGASGDIIFQTGGKGIASGSQNTALTALTIKGGTTNNTNVGQPSIVIGSAAIATNATDGFLYIASGAGTPTGAATQFTGRTALYYDSTNHQLWVQETGGSWLQPKTPAGAAIVTWQ